ncbi:two-component response regulator-like APRR5 [Daucus carota subsp. sativus]|uniref:CCT domain-containing protein n=1 Tax=Daucus carota subsp. sativus TaxID=79200 RepID=A0A162B3U0_DAUCS|nr:PREDICTED: two-component response regulator-like APRR5 [Daucus carota subsp. sativus]
MLQDVLNHPEQQQQQLPVQEISSPLSAQILEFCESELFPETLQNSEVASSSNCCYEEHSSYTTNVPFNTPEVSKLSDSIANNVTRKPFSNAPPPMSAENNTNTSNLSIIFDSAEDFDNDISASIDFSSSPTALSVPQFTNCQQQQFDISLLQTQLGVADNAVDASLSQYANGPVVPQIMGPPFPALNEDECLSSMPSYMRMNHSSPTCSFLDPGINSYLQSNLNGTLSTESSGIFTGNLFLGTDLQPQELDYQGDNGGLFSTEPLSRVYNSNLQALSNESQHLVNGGANATPLASEITSLEDSTFKVGKLSAEERKEKIHRYMKKRNERNFSKKIKYACRKTLADSRPRVRGRFAKNDDFGDPTRTTSSTHEEDTDEDVRSIRVVVKEEDDMVDSSDIFAHISGVNSFKCNYSIQSWI